MEATPVSRNMLDNVSPSILMLLLLTTLIAGGIVFLIRYVVSRRSRSSLKQDSSKNPDPSTWRPTAPPLDYIPMVQEPSVYSTSFHNGRRISLNKKRSKQVCLAPAHPWLCAGLRGHTNFIRDMSFSNNGKYVASSAEDWSLQPETDKKSDWLTSQYNESWLYRAMEKYILTSDELAKRGFPMQIFDHPGYAMINYTPYPTESQNSMFFCQNIDTKKRKKKEDLDCNGSSTDSTFEHKKENVLAIEKNLNETEKSDDNDSDSAEKCDSSSQQQKKECARCHKRISVDSTGKYLYIQRCIYHWGKLFDGRTNGEMNRKYWTCCKGLESSIGCETGVHVSVGLTSGLNGPLKGYVRTLPPNRYNNKYKICAIDCEMCYTEYGFELTRVTVISLKNEIIYDALVKPNSQIIDLNTRFSGITEKHMSKKGTMTLEKAQKKLLTLISAETILIGHNLESDFRALRLFHGKVVDTTVLYPHADGFPYRLGLKALARNVLKRNIQEKTHNSIEDAQAAMDLVLHKINEDIKSTTKKST